MPKPRTKLSSPAIATLYTRLDAPAAAALERLFERRKRERGGRVARAEIVRGLLIEAAAREPVHALVARALTPRALALYEALRGFASVSGWCPDAAVRDALAELMRAGVVVGEKTADGPGLWVMEPRTLDEAGALASGRVP